MIRKPGAQHAAPEMQLDIAMRIRMLDRCQMLSRNDQQPRFFAAFPNCTRPGRFIRFAFAAGKLGHSRQGNAFRPFADQHEPGRLDYRDSDSCR